LGPRINAAGRCSEAFEALELLLTDDAARAKELAQRLDGLNRERQNIEQRILTQARREALAALDHPNAPPALVLNGADWHVGVIGIVASRLVEEFYRPAVLIAATGETGAGRGSGRSIPGFHLAEALEAVKEHLTSFGGHAAAAGFELSLDALPAFRAAFEETARKRLTAKDLVPSLELEETVALEDVNRAFCEELAKLEPCGAGNPAPLLGVLGVQVAGNVRLTKDEKHVQMYVRQESAVRRAVGFGMGAHFNALCDLAKTGLMDVAFRPQLGSFRGESEVELHLKAFRCGGLEDAVAVSAAGV
jgi:single-stranded-DNA-specific exonuclease